MAHFIISHNRASLHSGGIWILVVGTDAGLNLHKRQQIICEKAVATKGKILAVIFENIII